MNVDNVTIISKVTSNDMLNIIIGILFGEMIEIGIVFIRELVNSPVKS